MKNPIFALFLTIISSSCLMAEEVCPDLTYDMIEKEAGEIFNLENKALRSEIHQKEHVDRLKKESGVQTVTIKGKTYNIQEAVFASTRHEKPVSLGEYLKNKGPDYVLKGRMKDGVCKYFLTTILEFDLVAK